MLEFLFNLCIGYLLFLAIFIVGIVLLFIGLWVVLILISAAICKWLE